MSLIQRYDPNSAANFNAALQSLEDLYLARGNAMEVIASGTLTSSVAAINVPLSGSWRWVHMVAALTVVAGSSQAILRANNDGTNSYYSCFLSVSSSGTFPSDDFGQNSLGIGAETAGGTPRQTDAWIFPTSLGFLATLSIAAADSDTLLRYGGAYVGGAVTSLQIMLGSSGNYEAGSAYILTGVRA